MAFLTLASETATPSYSSPIWSTVLEPLFWVTDFIVFLWLPPAREHNVPETPLEAFRKERLLNYRNHRNYVMECRNPRLFSLGLTSVFKDDQISWLGIVWRSSLVGGISIYNVWFWFHGIEYLATNSCRTYIFLFCKTDIAGPARTFFKFISVGYITYSGLLIFVCLYMMAAFMGTTLRSLFINFIIMPYVKVVLFFGGFGSRLLLRQFSEFQKNKNYFLRRLDIPSIDKIMKAVAYLASNPNQGMAAKGNVQDDTTNTKKSNW